MKTALDAALEALDKHEQKFVTNVREHGWVQTTVFEDETGPGFSYTTGFWITAGRPGLIIFSMEAEIAHDVFWDLFRRAQANKGLPVGKRTSAVFANLPAYAFPVAKKYYADQIGWTRWFYGGDTFPCLHILWPDRQEVFPWDARLNADFSDAQPDLTEQGWLAALSE